MRYKFEFFGCVNQIIFSVQYFKILLKLTAVTTLTEIYVDETNFFPHVGLNVTRIWSLFCFKLSLRDFQTISKVCRIGTISSCNLNHFTKNVLNTMSPFSIYRFNVFLHISSSFLDCIVTFALYNSFNCIY